MKQADLGLNLTTKRTRKRKFLDEMNLVVPWADLVALVVPFAPEDKKGRPPFAVSTMLRIHFMQQWFGLRDPAMEEALFDVPLGRDGQLWEGDDHLAEQASPPHFRHARAIHNYCAARSPTQMVRIRRQARTWQSANIAKNTHRKRLEARRLKCPYLS